jgi:CheY-like chemotaxis protein
VQLPHTAHPGFGHTLLNFACFCENPVGTDPAQLTGESAMQPELLISKKPTGTVLVVDDDDGVRRVLSRWVTDLGHQVLVANDADAALDQMRQHAVDVALCDVKMPGRDGIWLVDQLRRGYPRTSIVMATGLTELDPMVTLRPGVVGYIVKPFNRDELDVVIQKGLEAQPKGPGGPPRSPALLTDGQGSVIDGVILARYPA